ncbi:MAG: tRNA 2-thiouridine(34) synthase MnmA [Actinomycetota bacterium]|nr:tRNA 2-thiouridine(34) synthase MnmA [Actinomycetota bacterium]
MRVMVAMSGGVDSSVAAALAVERGWTVTGVTLKLWGGQSDSGCCSVSDVEDARRVSASLGIAHHVFDFSDEFDRHVVQPYVDAYAVGRTPNPCIECNRHLKFDRLLQRAVRLGFDAVVTGHHARVAAGPGGAPLVHRGRDAAKDQSYVLSMLRGEQLRRVLLPIGDLTKAEVRAIAARRGLATAAKPDSLDTCFISAAAGGREAFLASRIAVRPGRLVDHATGAVVGSVPSVQMVTVGQRRGLGAGSGRGRRYAVSVDIDRGEVRVGGRDDLLTDRLVVEDWQWTAEPAEGTRLWFQSSAHGAPAPGTVARTGERVQLHFDMPQRRPAPGQTVAAYSGDAVIGSGLVSGTRLF